MRKSTAFLVALIGLLILTNLGTLAHYRRRPAEPAPHPAESPAAARRHLEFSKLEAEIADQMIEIARLKEELQNAKLAGPKAGPASADAAAPTASLKEKLRKIIAIGKKQEEGEYDEAMEEMGDVMAFWVEYMSLMGTPSKDPAKYAEFLAALMEVVSEAGEAPLSAEQTRVLGAFTGDLESALAAAGPRSGFERQMAEIEACAAWQKKAMELLTPEQKQKLQDESEFMMIGSMSMTSARYVSDRNPHESIARDWAKALGLAETQKPYAEAAARTFAESLKESTRTLGISFADGEARGMTYGLQLLEYRKQTLQAQRDALKTLEGALTPEQITKLSALSLKDYYLGGGEAEMERESTPPPK